MIMAIGYKKTTGQDNISVEGKLPWAERYFQARDGSDNYNILHPHIFFRLHGVVTRTHSQPAVHGQ